MVGAGEIRGAGAYRVVGERDGGSVLGPCIGERVQLMRRSLPFSGRTLTTPAPTSPRRTSPSGWRRVFRTHGHPEDPTTLSRNSQQSRNSLAKPAKVLVNWIRLDLAEPTPPADILSCRVIYRGFLRGCCEGRLARWRHGHPRSAPHRHRARRLSRGARRHPLSVAIPPRRPTRFPCGQTCPIPVERCPGMDRTPAGDITVTRRVPCHEYGRQRRQIRTPPELDLRKGVGDGTHQANRRRRLAGSISRSGRQRAGPQLQTQGRRREVLSDG